MFWQVEPEQPTPHTSMDGTGVRPVLDVDPWIRNVQLMRLTLEIPGFAAWHGCLEISPEMLDLMNTTSGVRKRVTIDFVREMLAQLEASQF